MVCTNNNDFRHSKISLSKKFFYFFIISDSVTDFKKYAHNITILFFSSFFLKHKGSKVPYLLKKVHLWHNEKVKNLTEIESKM